MNIKTSRVARIKKTLWSPGKWIGDVILAITPEDEEKLRKLVGRTVLIETTFTEIEQEEPLPAAPPLAEKPPVSDPLASSGARSTASAGGGGSGSQDDLDYDEDDDDEPMPGWFKKWLQGGMAR